VGLKDVRVLAYERWGPRVELVIEQITGVVACPTCGERAQVKERPVVHYVDLPSVAAPMSLGWKKHRMHFVNPARPKKSWVLEDHRIAAKQLAHVKTRGPQPFHTGRNTAPPPSTE
jgi:DNA-directed RNA polymerase subunit RPC12/RpoP